MKRDIQAFVVIILFYGLLQIVGITCPIKYITGVSCAGCGMTRAWLSVLKLDINSAFTYHPLFILAIPLIFIFMFYRKISKKISASLLIMIAAAMIICYCIRLNNSDDMVVVFQPKDGLIFRGVHFLLNIKHN